MSGESLQTLTSTDGFDTRTKVLYFLTGNIIPSLLLMASAQSRELTVSWQSGHFRDYGALLLSGTSGWIFYPFFIYSVAAFTLGTMRPRQVCRSRLVLFGVMTGVLLSLQTCFLLGVVFMHIEHWNSWRGLLLIGVVLPLWVVAAIALPRVVWWLIRWAYSKRHLVGENLGWAVFLMFCGPLVGLTLGRLLGEDSFTWVVMLLLVPAGCVLAGGPVWVVATYSSLLIRLFRFQQTRVQLRLSDLLVVFAWLGAYLAAWRFAVEQAIEEYASLPTSPPSQCYIASAAAKGHAWYVRSFATRCASGEWRVVNAQLQYLKCGELAVKTLCPRLHRWIRKHYDRWGPACAVRLCDPLAADVTYTVLKPVEWSIRLAMRAIAPRASAIVPRLYRCPVALPAGKSRAPAGRIPSSPTSAGNESMRRV
jgi:hypothetical protein